jgi:hypothetical protein
VTLSETSHRAASPSTPVKRPERPLDGDPAIRPVTWHPHRDRDLVLADVDRRAALIHDMHACPLPGEPTWHARRPQSPVKSKTLILAFATQPGDARRAGTPAPNLLNGLIEPRHTGVGGQRTHTHSHPRERPRGNGNLLTSPSGGPNRWVRPTDRTNR